MKAHLGGVYEILNTTNGKRYVGSAVNLKRRERDHRSRLRGGYHSNQHLQRAWNKYGDECFEFSVLDYCESELLISFEQWWMDTLRPEYNIAPIAGNCLGMKHTKETNAKNRASSMGNQNLLGYRHTAEAIEKSRAASLGLKRTAEENAKNRATSMGNQNALGSKRTAEDIEKIRAAQLGSKDSAQTKAKKKAAAIKAWARRKAKAEANSTPTYSHAHTN